MTVVLFVTELHIWPPNGGEKIQAYLVLDCLSRMFDVTVLAPEPPADCPLLSQVRGWHALSGVPQSFRRRLLDSPFVLLPRRGWRKVLERLLTAVHPQVVWFNYGHWGQYAELAHRHGAAAVMQTHNAQSLLQRQGLASRPLTRWHLYYFLHYLLEGLHEQRLFRHFERVLSVSEHDQRYHARFIPQGRSLMLPNFVDEAWYKHESTEREAGTVVMTGNFGAFQNQAGAQWFVERVWPSVRAKIPLARLVLAGSAPAEWRQKFSADGSISCTGGQPSLVPYLSRAEVAVVPILHASGTRFKILEALACGTPIVSTSLGAEGIGLEDGVHCRLADAPAAFAEAVTALLTDRTLAQSLACSGLALLHKEFSLYSNCIKLAQIVTDLAKGWKYEGV